MGDEHSGAAAGRAIAGARGGLPPGVWDALDQAHRAWRAGGLPCGAALVDGTGTVVAVGRNHVYDAPTGEDVLESTPLAHAELNALARVDGAVDLGAHALWSTQQPCAMCATALRWCGVGGVRWLAADPAFIGTDDARAGDDEHDVVAGDQVLAPWGLLANAMFLQPSIARGDAARLGRNRRHDADAVDLAVRLARTGPADTLEEVVAGVWPITPSRRRP